MHFSQGGAPFSLTWTTIHIVCLLELSTYRCSSGLPESKCTWERHRCGTVAVMSLQHVVRWRWPAGAWCPMPGHGEEDGFQPTSKGSGCLASQWATLSTCSSSRPPPRSTRPSTNASSRFSISRTRGFFSSATYSLRGIQQDKVAQFCSGPRRGQLALPHKVVGRSQGHGYSVAGLPFNLGACGLQSAWHIGPAGRTASERSNSGTSWQIR